MIEKFRYKNWEGNTPSSILEYLFTPAPLGVRLANFFFQKILRINSRITFMVHFTSIVSGNVQIGRNVARYIANCGGCYLQGINGIKIGDDTMIAPGVKIISANHDIFELDKHVKEPPILIGNRCWLGSNSVILPGVTLGDNVIVAAGSVVTKSFPNNVVIGGVPAKILREI